ncbi:MAG: glycosyltransferase [Crocinitomicaceae bacterium]|nr:glycosyltransferase [Crocinitomicaceae bacterium]
MSFIPEIEFNLITIVFFVFCFAVLLQLYFILRFPIRLLRKKYFKEAEKKSNLPNISVIICARNEEDSLAKNIPLILEQDYPFFELIVVNDQSMDESAAIIKALQTKHKNLRLIDLKRNQHKRIGKKLPLTVGIKGAKHEHVVLTDADCRPTSKKWLRRMVEGYTEEKEIVLGYSPYTKAKGFLNRMIRFDTAMIGANYFGFALAGRAYMGVGRNLSYKRELFFKVEGFKDHYHVQSGDDDLFVQQVATKSNVGIQVCEDAHIESAPKKTWKAWIRQKQRHFTTAPEYRLINKILLGIFPTSMFLMLSSFVILLVNYEWWLFVLAIFTLRTIIYWLVYSKVLKKLNEQDLRGWYPVMELAHFLIIPFIYYGTNRSSKKPKW